MTGVSLAEVIKEQEKVKAVKFPIRTNEQSLNLISQQDSTPKQSQWEQICFGYISKILCNNLN